MLCNRTIGIIQLVANGIGIIIGFVLGSNGASIDTTIVWLLVVGTIILITSFYLSGISVDRAIMWKHLTYVSIGVAIVSFCIDLLLLAQINGEVVFITLLQAFVAMGIGGSLARIRKPQVAATPPSASSYPKYHQQSPETPHQVYAPTIAGLQPPVIAPRPPNGATQATTWGYLVFSDGKQFELMGKRIVVGRVKDEKKCQRCSISEKLCNGFA